MSQSTLFLIIIAMLAGYVAARFFPQLGNAVGLP